MSWVGPVPPRTWSWRGGPAMAPLLAACLLTVVPADAQAQHHDNHGAQLDFTRAPADTVAWGTLAKVYVQRVDGKLARTFTAPLRALDGKKIALYGYVTRVDDAPGPQRLFLLSSQKIACRGCAAPVEPEGIVEVTLSRAVDLVQLLKASDAAAVRGKLVLVKDDSRGLIYQMVDARLVPQDNSTGPR